MSTRAAQQMARYRLGDRGGQCNTCHADVLFLRDPDDGAKKLPVDPAEVPDGPVSVDLARGIVRWMSPGEDPMVDGRRMLHRCIARLSSTGDRLAPDVPAAAGTPRCEAPIADLFDGTQRLCTLPVNHSLKEPCRA